MKGYSERRLIFGLDIGTRTVIGCVGYMENEKFQVIESITMAHQDRAMMDGQIHDIPKVAEIVGKVKRELEKRLEIQLKETAIAAAGRVLTTQITQIEKTFDEVCAIHKADIQLLEMAGIDEAKKLLEKERRMVSVDYFCVAHTVIHYYLDGYTIGNLEGHKGEVIGAQILATFLPKAVIDSLYAVTERAGLQVTHLTLEPIAAMNAVIPENLRLLNLALVDVGAGTSDIAITKEGSVVAYGMIPFAGDEVTEAIVHQYLVDFNMAEKMKQALGTQDEIHYEDIIGIPSMVSRESLLECIESPLSKLAEHIAKKILKLNGKKPTNAVFCVGGGSQMPGLIEKIAKELGLLEQRVAMRNKGHIQHIKEHCTLPNGPEMITPIGICLTAAKASEEQFIGVKVNEIEVKLLQTKSLTVLDALLEAGINHTQIFPTNGKTLMFKLNGERIRIKGKVGRPSTLLLNNHTTALDAPIQNGDSIILIKARDGEDASAILQDYVHKDKRKSIEIGGTKLELPILLVNGDCVSNDYKIKTQDHIECIEVTTLGELFKVLKKDYQKFDVTVNCQMVDETYCLQEGDKILLTLKEVVQQLMESQQKDEKVEVQSVEAVEEGLEIWVNDEKMVLPPKSGHYMFVNIFDHIDFDLTCPKGTVQLLLNGERAAVTERLKRGDRLQIYWEN